MMLSLPLSSACWSSSGQLVSAALYWEQQPHQVPVPAGHTALLATAATANQKALLPGQSLMEQAWRDLLSVRLGAPGSPMQCLLCSSPQWAEHTRSVEPPAGNNNPSGGVYCRVNTDTQMVWTGSTIHISKANGEKQRIRFKILWSEIPQEDSIY